MIFFPFDLDAYLKVRNFFVDYDEFVYGPRCDNVASLVDTLTAGAWSDTSPFAHVRARLTADFFPYEEPKYRQTCYQTICDLARQKDSDKTEL